MIIALLVIVTVMIGTFLVGRVFGSTEGAYGAERTKQRGSQAMRHQAVHYG